MVGWAQFFFWSFLFALPGVWLVWSFRAQLHQEAGRDARANVGAVDL